MGEHRLAELLNGGKATSEQDVAVLVGECKRLKASEARLIEALKAIGNATCASKNFWYARKFLDERDIFNGDLSGDAVLEAVARAALKGAE